MKNSEREAEIRDAEDLLFDPSEFPPLPFRDRSGIQLQLYRSVSFEPEVTWTIYLDEKSGAWHLRRLRWNSSGGWRMKNGLSLPTIFAAETLLEEDKVRLLIRSLDQLAIHSELFKPTTITLDGTQHGLWSPPSSLPTRIFWKEGLEPPGAERLGEWFKHCVSMLEASLASKTGELPPRFLYDPP